MKTHALFIVVLLAAIVAPVFGQGLYPPVAFSSGGVGERAWAGAAVGAGIGYFAGGGYGAALGGGVGAAAGVLSAVIHRNGGYYIQEPNGLLRRISKKEAKRIQGEYEARMQQGQGQMQMQQQMPPQPQQFQQPMRAPVMSPPDPGAAERLRQFRARQQEQEEIQFTPAPRAESPMQAERSEWAERHRRVADFRANAHFTMTNLTSFPCEVHDGVPERGNEYGLVLGVMKPNQVWPATRPHFGNYSCVIWAPNANGGISDLGSSIRVSPKITDMGWVFTAPADSCKDCRSTRQRGGQ